MKLFSSVFALSALSAATVFGELPAYDHHIGFGPNFNPFGASVGYEHTKTDSFYLGASTIFNKNSQFHMMLIGYNFALSEKDTLTPSIGGAILHDRYFGTEWIPLVSLEYKHRINDRFTIGSVIGSVPKDNFNLAVGIPFTVHFGENRDWDFRVLPTYMTGREYRSSYHAFSLGYSIGKSF